MLVQARRADLIVTEVGPDLLVYDTHAKQLHTLPEPIAIVWRRCDGRATVADIADQTFLAEDAVIAAVEQLRGAGLLEGALPLQRPSRDRRTLLKQAAAGAVIVSVTAPLAAQAQSIAGSCWYLVSGGAWQAWDADYEQCKNFDSCSPGGGGASGGGCYKWATGANEPGVPW